MCKKISDWTIVTKASREYIDICSMDPGLIQEKQTTLVKYV